MKKNIIEILKKTNKEMRAREIADELKVMTMGVSLNLRELEEDGIVIGTLHNDFLSGQAYFTWRMA